MENVVLIIHLILALAIIGLVLIQRSEGGGLGIGGGGGGMGGFATPKGTASALTKMTAFFATCFFITSLTLAILAGNHGNKDGILATYSAEAEQTIDERTEVSQEVIEADSSSEDTASEEVTTENGEEAEEAIEEPAENPVEKPSVPIGE